MENKQLKSFKDLVVWQKSSDLAALIYSITEKFPRSELYGLTNQMRRSTVSISSNIAEGFKRNHKKEKLQFYNIAYGSAAELESQIEIALKLNFISTEDYQKLTAPIIEISKMLNGLIKSANKSPKSYLLNSIFFFVLLYSVFYILTPFPIYGAELFFETRNRELGVGQEFRIDLRLNTEGENINAVEGKVIFSAELLELEEVRDGNSIINFWVEKPFLNSKSYILYSGITPGGFNSEKGLIFSAIFEARQEGIAKFEINDTRVLRNDGSGSTAKLEVQNLEFSIQDLGAKETPYPKSYILYPQDNELPESFAPEIAKDATLFDGKWFVVFATQDKASGVDHYEVLEYRRQDLGFRELMFKFFPKFYILYSKSWISNAESPHVLTDQELRSFVWIKAVDKAGNERIATVEPYYPMKWYENWLIWIIIAIIGAIAYLIWRGFKSRMSQITN